MIPLASVSAPSERSLAPELADGKQPNPTLPELRTLEVWTAQVPEDLSIARIQSPAAAQLISLDLRILEHQVSAPGSLERFSVCTLPTRFSGRDLWSKPVSADRIENSLHRSPVEPHETKFRIWLQPLDETAEHRLSEVPLHPYAMVRLDDPSVSVPLLVASPRQALAPEAEEIDVSGISPQSTNPLGEPCGIAPAEIHYTLFPAFRRLPLPVYSLS